MRFRPKCEKLKMISSFSVSVGNENDWFFPNRIRFRSSLIFIKRCRMPIVMNIIINSKHIFFVRSFGLSLSCCHWQQHKVFCGIAVEDVVRLFHWFRDVRRTCPCTVPMHSSKTMHFQMTLAHPNKCQRISE